MTDVLFVHNYYEFHIGIMQISAVLKQHGFSTDVVIGPQSAILKKTLRIKPRAVGFYCTTGVHHKYLRVAQEIKKFLQDETLTVFGGPHPTFVPTLIESPGVDIVCRGEGEFAFVELLQALYSGADYTGIKNLWVRKDNRIFRNGMRALSDPNTLPYPDRELYRNIPYIYQNNRQEVMLGRGCPFHCSFCASHAYRVLTQDAGTYVRHRSVENAIGELEEIKNKYHPTCFFFHDETLFHKHRKEYYIEFLNVYKDKIGLPFNCLIRADAVTEDLIRIVKECGCYFTSFGIECGNETMRNRLLNKNLPNETILECARLLHRYRIPFATFNMVGLPGETLQNVWETVALNMAAKPAWAWFAVYQPLPETELAQYAMERGLLNQVDVMEADASYHESSQLLRNHPDGRVILRLKNLANIVVKHPWMKTPTERFLLKLPWDRFYNTVYRLLYFVCYYTKLTYQQGFFRSVKAAFFLGRRQKEF